MYSAPCIELFYGKSIWDSGSRVCLDDNIYGDRYFGGMGGIKGKVDLKFYLTRSIAKDEAGNPHPSGWSPGL